MRLSIYFSVNGEALGYQAHQVGMRGIPSTRDTSLLYGSHPILLPEVDQGFET